MGFPTASISSTGRHQLAVGVEYSRLQLNEFNLLDANGTIQFNGQITKDSILDFMLGKPSNLAQNAPDGMAFRQNYGAVYGEDNFKVTRNLNVHVGVRWEPFMPERDTFGRGSYFSLADFIAGKKTNQILTRRRGCSLTATRESPTDTSITGTATLPLASAWPGTRRDPAGRACEHRTGSSSIRRIHFSTPNTPTLRRGATVSLSPILPAGLRTHTPAIPGAIPSPARCLPPRTSRSCWQEPMSISAGFASR